MRGYCGAVQSGAAGVAPREVVHQEASMKKREEPGLIGVVMLAIVAIGVIAVLVLASDLFAVALQALSE